MGVFLSEYMLSTTVCEKTSMQVQATLSKFIPRNYYAHTVNNINATSAGTGFRFDDPGPAVPEMRRE